MATTKYIIDNLSGQTINGDITINGNLNVTGVTTGSLGTYKALLTQTSPFNVTNLTGLYGAFIIGETYTITEYNSRDDFSNIANVQSGDINTTGCVFIATGETPSNWDYGSSLTSSGNLAVSVLENTLGYNIDWSMNPFGGQGNYIGTNATAGLIYNSFNRESTSITTQITSLNFPPDFNQFFTSVVSYTNKDDALFLSVWNYDIGASVNDYLYYTPIQIDIKKDLDITPIVINGSVNSSFPFSNVSVDLVCGRNNIETFYGGGYVNNITEMVNQLNSDSTTSYLGTYSLDGSGGVILEIAANLANQFCSNETLTFSVFSD